jgi:hypothetical protein
MKTQTMIDLKIHNKLHALRQYLRQSRSIELSIGGVNPS